MWVTALPCEACVRRPGCPQAMAEAQQLMQQQLGLPEFNGLLRVRLEGAHGLMVKGWVACCAVRDTTPPLGASGTETQRLAMGSSEGCPLSAYLRW